MFSKLVFVLTFFCTLKQENMIIAYKHYKQNDLTDAATAGEAILATSSFLNNLFVQSSAAPVLSHLPSSPPLAMFQQYSYRHC